jgi:hypothetical protein
MASMHSGVTSTRRRTLVPVLALTALLMLVAASSALGQAAVDQYIPSASPTGHHGRDEGGGGNIGGGGGGTGSGGSAKPDNAAASQNQSLSAGGAGLANVSSGESGPGSASGGNAPGTDYPLTTFVFVIIGLVAAGTVVTVLLRRRRAGHAA